jgi:hypothetical protein
MPNERQETPSIVAVAVRTLLVSGYVLDSAAVRQPTHIEIRCGKLSVFGVRVPFLIAITDTSSFTAEQIGDITALAVQETRSPVFVGSEPTDSQLGWEEFLSALGGQVPSWRAVSSTYAEALLTAASNRLPPNTTGEAWLIFEDLVCDGLEFVFGRRAHRLGGRRRGQKVSDIVAVLPGTELLIVDAKATQSEFDANWPSLRPLVEYVKKQQQRQQGHNIVHSAAIVSSNFEQSSSSLQELSNTFFAETHLPLTFVTADILSTMVIRLQQSTDVRAAINWKRVFSGGALLLQTFEREFKEASNERIVHSEY